MVAGLERNLPSTQIAKITSKINSPETNVPQDPSPYDYQGSQEDFANLARQAGIIVDQNAREDFYSNPMVGNGFTPDAVLPPNGDANKILVQGGREKGNENYQRLYNTLREYQDRHPHASLVNKVCNDTLAEYGSRSEPYTVRVVNNFLRTHRVVTPTDTEITALLEHLYNERENARISAEIVGRPYVFMGGADSGMARARGRASNIHLLADETRNAAAVASRKLQAENEAAKRAAEAELRQQREERQKLSRDLEEYSEGMAEIVLDSMSENDSYDFVGQRMKITKVGDKFSLDGGTLVTKDFASGFLRSHFRTEFREADKEEQARLLDQLHNIQVPLLAPENRNAKSQFQ
jgi:hypothetical protein